MSSDIAAGVLGGPGGGALGGSGGDDRSVTSDGYPRSPGGRRSRAESGRGTELESGSVVSASSPSGAGVAKNFMVVIRVRPPLERELHGDRPFRNVVRVDRSKRAITISENIAATDESGAPGPYSAHKFTFDHVHDQHEDQRTVYETTAKAVVESSLQGYNATIFAYGQTGTGKTYTMEGFNSAERRGIIPRAIEQIFRHITSSVSPRMRFLVRASYLQIYNEVISDLLKPERSNLVIREDKKRGVFVEGLSEWVVRSPAEIYGLMERGRAMRATGSTRMNLLSSRSHAVFIIIAEQSETTYLDDEGNEMTPEQFHRLVKARAHGDAALSELEANVRQSFRVGKLNLVDLAGSERVRLTGATGQRLEESRKINGSLSALGNVIAALTDPRGRQHIPYRDSKLTRILEDSLGGNCKTTMMAMISPALEAFVESLSTLRFANRAKNIRNEAHVNEDLDQKSLLRRYERELKRLRSELEERSRNVVDKRRLLEIDEQRRRAELDKMAAIRALEARSREFLKEKEEKRKLEERIASLQSQMLIGGDADSNGGQGGGANGAPSKLLSTAAFRNALKEHQEKMRKEYERRLQDLERERETIEAEKVEIGRYKVLLLKQRDIMILLTQRLNERDDQIVALQDELDAYDRHQRDLEEKLDEKTAALIHLQRVVVEHNALSPVKSAELMQALGAWGGTEMDAAAPGDGRTGPRRAPLDPNLLLSTRQFLAHHSGGGGAMVVGSAERASADPTKSSRMLSALEKIDELTRLLDEAQTENAKLSRRLQDSTSKDDEEPHPTPASTSASHSGSASPDRVELAQVRAEQERAERQVRELQAKLRTLEENRRHESASSPSSSSPATSKEVVDSIRSRLATHEKERKAIHTIIEHKIKALADNIVRIGATLPEAQDPIPVQTRLLRESRALQRLVDASVVALRNAEAEAAAAARREEALVASASPSPSTSHGATSRTKERMSVDEMIQRRKDAEKY